MTDIRRSPAADSRTDSRKRQKAAGFALMLAALLILPVKAGALELSLSGGAGNAGFTADGDFPSGIRPAFSLGIQSDISDNLSAGFFVRQDTLSGRTMAAEFSYTGGFLTLTAGPVFGLLNGSGEKTGQPLLLQPGLRLGISMFFLDCITLEASSDICLRTAAEDTGGQMYPAQARLAAGVAFPFILCSLAASQKSAEVPGDGGYRQIRTDYGLYTRVFGKNSPFRFDVNFIYREMDFSAPGDTGRRETEIRTLVIGGGVEFCITRFTFFLNGEGSLYTLSAKQDGGKLDTGNPFLYDIQAGVRILFR